MSRHGSDVVGCAQPSERSARRIACPYRAVLASDATPRCTSMASADRQMIGDATLAGRATCSLACANHSFILLRLSHENRRSSRRWHRPRDHGRRGPGARSRIETLPARPGDRP
ncbi:hypothetical protein D8B29_24880 [Verminephrobacter eiseniae]|nr:hypothetical protein [Verminephrobacter eiseniae]